MYDHSIEFVGDDELPDGHDFMLVMCDGGTGRLFYRESAITPQVLADSWEAYRAFLCAHDQRPVAETRVDLRLVV